MRHLAIGLIGMSCSGGAMYLLDAGKWWQGLIFMFLIFCCIICLSEEKDKKLEV